MSAVSQDSELDGEPREPRRSPGRAQLADALAARSRADVVSGLRGLRSPPRSAVGTRRPAAAAPGPGAAGAVEDGERCDLCGTGLDEDHRHLLDLAERRIACACESCFAMRSGDGDYRPTGNRTLWLEGLRLPDELWASFGIPIGLAFFMDSSTAGCVVALYPSPGGATESELHFSSWSRMVELNPVLAGLESDVEALIVNRMAEPPRYAIAPIDRCYALAGAIKASWEGISGGQAVDEAVASFFAQLRASAVPA